MSLPEEEAEDRWARLGSGVMCLLCGVALAVVAAWYGWKSVTHPGTHALWGVLITEAAFLAMAVLLVRVGFHNLRPKPRG